MPSCTTLLDLQVTTDMKFHSIIDISYQIFSHPLPRHASQDHRNGRGRPENLRTHGWSPSDWPGRNVSERFHGTGPWLTHVQYLVIFCPTFASCLSCWPPAPAPGSADGNPLHPGKIPPTGLSWHKVHAPQNRGEKAKNDSRMMNAFVQAW